MLKKILISVAAILALIFLIGFLLLRFSKVPDSFPESSESANWSEHGKYTVSALDFTLRDKSRETQSHEYFASFEGMPYRELELTVWYPENENKQRYPLIVYSHAFMSERGDISYILQRLSSRGYIVLAANYPLTSKSSGDALLMADVVNQPADISFLISQITNSMTDIGQSFSHLIDMNKIGVMGYSLGGLASTLVAYHPTHIDSRIGAVVSIAGPSAMLDENFYQNNRVPFMMVAGTSDEMTPFKDHAAIIPKRVKNSVLVTIDGGSHMGFAGMSAILRWNNNPDSLACSLMTMKMDSMGITRGNEEKAWYSLIGSNDQGVIYDDTSMACNPDDAGRAALNPLRQQMLARVSIISFFESIFNNSAEVRHKAKLFLATDLAKENAEVYVEGEYISNCQPLECQ